MKNYFKIITILSLFVFFGCSKDEVPNTAPEIKAQSFNALEDITSSSIIGKVIATDAESTDLNFSITYPPNTANPLIFEISNNGDLKLAAGKSLDYNASTIHTITVKVTDGDLSASATVTINVIDVNAAIPVFTQSGPFTVEEDADETKVIGTVSATDADGDVLEFLISSSSLFKIDKNSGAISLKSTSSLDFETKAQYSFQITAFDGTINVSTPVIINVTNINEVPVISDNSTINDVAEDIADTVIIGTIEATDPEGDALTWSLTTNPDNLFEINNSGEISLATGKSLDYETETSHEIAVHVSDAGSLSATAVYTINITDVAEGTVVNIPDANFKAVLLSLTPINTNGDNEIQVAEAISFSGSINVSNNSVSDLTGIEAFINIRELYCNNNSLTSLDVSKNTALTRLWCYSNNLTNLDVSNNTALTQFYCYENDLTSIDISNNTVLGDFSVRKNKLTSLDVSNNTALGRLWCENNLLTNLDVSNNTNLTLLKCDENNLTSLDVSNNTALTELRVYKNKLTSLDVSNNTALSTLSVSDNDLTSLDVSNNTVLSILFCAVNKITDLDVSSNTALTRLRCMDNNLTSLDISNGNNTNMWDFMADSNTNLTCIKIDAGFTPPSSGWVKDAGASYNATCP